MSWISKGDLVEVNGVRVIAAGDDYTRIVWEDCGVVDCSFAVGCVDVIYPSGERRTVRMDRSNVVPITDGARATA